MLNQNEILETLNMISKENLDIRTITMGISLLDCAGDDVNIIKNKIYDKVTKKAEKLVEVGNQIEREYGIPIINKRISVTPISLVSNNLTSKQCVEIAKIVTKIIIYKPQRKSL